MSLRCANCSHVLQVQPGLEGRKARCGKCGHKFVISATQVRPTRAAAVHGAARAGTDQPGTRTPGQVKPRLEATPAGATRPGTPRTGSRRPAAALPEKARPADRDGALRPRIASVPATPRPAAVRRAAPAVAVAPASSSALGVIDEIDVLPESPRTRPNGRDESSPAPTGPGSWAPLRRRAEPRDFDTEAHLRAISFWDRIFGILSVLAGVGFFLFGASMTSRAAAGGAGSMALMGGFMGTITLILLVLGTGAYLLGHFLWNYHAWARWTAGILAALWTLRTALSLLAVSGLFGLLGTGIGLLWHGSMAWVLFSPAAAAICTKEYRARVEASPAEGPSWCGSPFFWLPLVWVGLLFMGGAGLSMLAR